MRIIITLLPVGGGSSKIEVDDAPGKMFYFGGAYYVRTGIKEYTELEAPTYIGGLNAWHHVCVYENTNERIGLAVIQRCICGSETEKDVS